MRMMAQHPSTSGLKTTHVTAKNGPATFTFNLHGLQQPILLPKWPSIEWPKSNTINHKNA